MANRSRVPVDHFERQLIYEISSKDSTVNRGIILNEMLKRIQDIPNRNIQGMYLTGTRTKLVRRIRSIQRGVMYRDAQTGHRKSLLPFPRDFNHNNTTTVAITTSDVTGAPTTTPATTAEMITLPPIHTYYQPPPALFGVQQPQQMQQQQHIQQQVQQLQQLQQPHFDQQQQPQVQQQLQPHVQQMQQPRLQQLQQQPQDVQQQQIPQLQSYILGPQHNGNELQQPPHQQHNNPQQQQVVPVASNALQQMALPQSGQQLDMLLLRNGYNMDMDTSNLLSDFNKFGQQRQPQQQQSLQQPHVHTPGPNNNNNNNNDVATSNVDNNITTTTTNTNNNTLLFSSNNWQQQQQSIFDPNASSEFNDMSTLSDFTEGGLNNLTYMVENVQRIACYLSRVETSVEVSEGATTRDGISLTTNAPFQHIKHENASKSPSKFWQPWL